MDTYSCIVKPSYRLSMTQKKISEDYLHTFETKDEYEQLMLPGLDKPIIRRY